VFKKSSLPKHTLKFLLLTLLLKQKIKVGFWRNRVFARKGLNALFAALA
jgi:hypothetical protein